MARDLDKVATSNESLLKVFGTKELVAEIRRRNGAHPIEVEHLVTEIDQLELGALGAIRRQVLVLWEHKTKHFNGFTPDELALLDNKDFIGCVKAVRERLGVGLADAKMFVDKWTGKGGTT